MIASSAIHVNRTPPILEPDQSRVLLRPFSPGGPKDGIEKPVLYKGKQVYVDGKPLYEYQYSVALLMFLLRAYDREKFGDRQVIELKLEDWDGDLSKLSEQSARRLLAQIEEKIAIEEAKEVAQLPAGQVIDGKSERVPE